MLPMRMCSVIAVAGMIELLVQPAGGQGTPGPQPETGQAAATSSPAVQQAYELLTRARNNIAGTISDCSGGSILVVVCPPKTSRPTKLCREPVGSCEAVAAFRSTQEALADLQKAMNH